MIPIQAVTLVTRGGTPMQLADQRGAPFATTGRGALVFNTGAYLIDPIIENAILGGPFKLFPGDFFNPSIQFTTDVDDRTPGFYSTGPGNISLVGTNGTEATRAHLAQFDHPGNLTLPNFAYIGGDIPADDDSTKAATTAWVQDIFDTFQVIIQPRGIAFGEPTSGVITSDVNNLNWTPATRSLKITSELEESLVITNGVFGGDPWVHHGFTVGAYDAGVGTKVFYIQLLNYGGTESGGEAIYMFGARGVEESPVAVQANDLLGAIVFGGWAVTTLRSAGELRFEAHAAPVDDSGVPGRMRLRLNHGTGHVTTQSWLYTGMLAFGEIPSEAPALKPNGSILQARLANDSALTGMEVLTPPSGDNDTSVATTEWVARAIAENPPAGAMITGYWRYEASSTSPPPSNGRVRFSESQPPVLGSTMSVYLNQTDDDGLIYTWAIMPAAGDRLILRTTAGGRMDILVTSASIAVSYLIITGTIDTVSGTINNNVRVAISLVQAPDIDWEDIDGKPVVFPPEAHLQPASSITDFSEAVDDRVNALLIAGSNIGLTYNDSANTLTITAIVDTGSVADVGLTPPLSPTHGQIWFYNDAIEDGGQLYIYYDDGSSAAWIPATPAEGGSSGVTGDYVPLSGGTMTGPLFAPTVTVGGSLSGSAAGFSTNVNAGSTPLVITNSNTGTSALVDFVQDSGGRYVVRRVFHSGQFLWEGGTGILARYSDFDTQYFRSNAGVDRLTLSGTAAAFTVPITSTGLTFGPLATGSGFGSDGTNIGIRGHAGGGIYFQGPGGTPTYGIINSTQLSLFVGLTGTTAGFTTSLLVGGAGVGKVRLISGDATHAGHIAFHDAADVRIGYIGYSAPIITYSADVSGSYHDFYASGNTRFGIIDNGARFHGATSGTVTVKSAAATGGAHIVQLPSASGILALTTDIIGYVSNYLPLAGGNLSGALSGPTASFSSMSSGPLTLTREADPDEGAQVLWYTASSGTRILSTDVYQGLWRGFSYLKGGGGIIGLWDMALNGTAWNVHTPVIFNQALTGTTGSFTGTVLATSMIAVRDELGNDAILQHLTNVLYIRPTGTGAVMYLGASGTNTVGVLPTFFYPVTDNAASLGGSGNRWATIHSMGGSFYGPVAGTTATMSTAVPAASNDTTVATTAWVRSIVPPGVIMDFAGTVPPSGWLLCNGQSVTVAAYPALHAAIGFLYGGAGANFNVPDLRGRVTAGPDGGTNRLRNAYFPGGESNTIASAGGQDAVQYNTTISELFVRIGGWDSPAQGYTASGYTTGAQYFSATSDGASSFLYGITTSGGSYAADAHTHAVYGWTNGDSLNAYINSFGAHGTTDAADRATDVRTNIPPTVIMNKIIKV